MYLRKRRKGLKWCGKNKLPALIGIYFICLDIGYVEDLCGPNRRKNFHVLQISTTRVEEEPGVEHEDNAGRRDQSQITLRIVFLK